MSKLIKLSAKIKKSLGIITEKKGDFIDKKRLAEFKKFNRPKKEEPTRQINKLPSKAAVDKKSDESKGLY